MGWICLQRRPEVDWSNKNTCLPSNSNSWEMLNMKYHFYIKQCFPVKVTFGNVLVWFLIWSNGRGAGRLVCTTKWEINNRQTPNGGNSSFPGFVFFFPFLPKTKSIIKHLFRGILFRDNKFETFAFDSIYDSEKNSLFWIHRNVMFLQSHCFDFTLPFCQGFSLGFLFIVLTLSDLASATLSLINFIEKYCKLNNNKTMCK